MFGILLQQSKTLICALLNLPRKAVIAVPKRLISFIDLCTYPPANPHAYSLLRYSYYTLQIPHCQADQKGVSESYVDLNRYLAYNH